MKIPFCRPFIGKEEAKAATKAIMSGWITTSKITEEVEKKIADYVGAKYCILLTSCTAALHLSLEYLKRFKLNNRFRVLVPSLTFAATATEVINSGGELIFGDVDKNTMCLKRPKYSNYDIAIPVHLYGIKARTDYDCLVIEDSAHLIEKNQCKNNPNLVCMSFYASKNVTMGEGGAICTNDDNAAMWFRQARHHGISSGGWERYQKTNKWKYDIEFIGWKYNPSDVLSAILGANFNKIEKIHKERKRCVDLYNKLLDYNNRGLHLYPILISDRLKFMKIMEESGIGCSVHFLPLHRMTAFKQLNIKSDDLTNTNYFGDRLVSLPLFPLLTNKEIRYICAEVKKTGLLIKSRMYGKK
jgi:dTDP-4-amino-4,6-dideoxygalactose transaminase